MDLIYNEIGHGEVMSTLKHAGHWQWEYTEMIIKLESTLWNRDFMIQSSNLFFH